MRRPWHAMTVEEVLNELKTSLKGLSSREASARLQEYGPNELEETKKRGVLEVFVDQFKSVLVALLVFAAVFSILIREYVDAAAIGAILIVNSILGTIQEYRAERALEALKRLAAPRAAVIRDGVQVKIASTEVVPGDVIVLQAGDRVPADARLIESVNLKVDESVLTGESVPVEKLADVVLDEDTPLSERRNMVYSSTVVSYGRGKAVVVGTGMNTEIGRIAAMVQLEEKEETP
ncbi:MAG TPA: ATPase, partial [Candidatus Korarchaeota archaeon]|nr:ATPase [Candidatus Korarchaeota archaeon]